MTKNHSSTMPNDEVVASVVARLVQPAQTEYFLERWAIREYDGGLAADYAAALAILETLLHWPMALLGLGAIAVGGAGPRRWVLTNDAEALRQRVLATGFRVADARDLAAVVRERYAGAALLAPFHLPSTGRCAGDAPASL